MYLIIGNVGLFSKVREISQQKAEGASKLLHSGLDKEKGLKFIALELLDKTLEEWFSLCNCKFSLETVSMIAISLVIFLKHSLLLTPLFEVKFSGKRARERIYIQRSLTQELHDWQRSTSQCHLCNWFWSCKTVHHKWSALSTETNTLWRYSWVCLTACSERRRYLKYIHHILLIQFAKGYSRRSDIESLGYLLIHFATGALCWHSNKTSPKKSGRKQMYLTIARSRERISLDKLCCGLPGFAS